MRNCSAQLIVSSALIVCLFFFQAEDGIRDYKVTGVQTCALPIFDAAAEPAPEIQPAVGDRPLQLAARAVALQRADHRVTPAPMLRAQIREVAEIGRASCRERV